MARVVTSHGTVYKATKAVPGRDRERAPLTIEDAQGLAARCNKRAEELGLKVRYEAKEDDAST